MDLVDVGRWMRVPVAARRQECRPSLFISLWTRIVRFSNLIEARMRLSYFFQLLMNQGSSIMAPLLAGFIGIVFAVVIRQKDLDVRWRRAFFALTPLPLLLGISAFCAEAREHVGTILNHYIESDYVGESLRRLSDTLPVLVVGSGATALLVALGALLYLPIRSWRPGTVKTIWIASVAMILLSYIGVPMVLSEMGRGQFLWTAPSDLSFGWISWTHDILTGHFAPLGILLWLVLCAFVSRRVDQGVKLRLAYIGFTLAALITLFSVLILIKGIVVIHHSHPAIAGNPWVISLNVHAW